MKLLFILAVLLFTLTCRADMTTPPKANEGQYFLNQNKLINPGFELGLTGVSTTTTSATIITTANLLNDGSRALSWNPSAAATLDLSSWSTPSGSQTNGMAQCAFRTDDHDYDLQVIDASQTIVASTDIYSDSAGFIYYKTSVPFTINPNGSQTYKLRVNAPGDENQLYVDSCYLGPNPTINYSENFSNIYSARVLDGSSTTSVTQENTDWINGNCTNPTAGHYTCTLNNGVFINPPNCTCSMNTTTNPIICTIDTAVALTNTSVSIETFTNAGADSDGDFFLTCQKSEVDSGFVVRMDQTNFDWMDTTCTSSWTTNATNTCKAKRQGSNLIVKHKVTLTGAPQSTTLRLTIPLSLTIDTAKFPGTVGVSSTIVGSEGSILDNGIATSVAIEQYSSTSVVGVNYISSASGALTNVTQALPFTFGSGDAVEVQYSVPISGWTENQNAPLIIGGITSGYSGSLRIETASVATTGTVVSESMDWINGNCTNASPQVCTLNSGTFTSTPICSVTNQDLGSGSFCFGAASNANSFSMKCVNDGGTTTTTSLSKSVICVGPR